MTAPTAIPEYKRWLDQSLLSLPAVTEGKMFGCPGYFVNGKLAVCHYGRHFFVKLPADRIDTLVAIDQRCVREGPMGPKRSMGREWMFMHAPTLRALKDKTPLLLESISFVLIRTASSAAE